MTKTKRQLQSEATKIKIYKTSIKLIQKYGFDNVTVDEICEACEIAKGTFYVHFKSKEEIIAEVTSNEEIEYLKRKHAEFIKVHPEASAIELLENTFITLLKFHKKMQASIMRLSFMRTITRNSLSSYPEKLIGQLIKQGIENNEFKSSVSEEDVYTTCQIFLIGIIYRWVLFEGEFDIVATSKPQIKFFLGSLAK